MILNVTYHYLLHYNIANEISILSRNTLSIRKNPFLTLISNKNLIIYLTKSKIELFYVSHSFRISMRHHKISFKDNNESILVLVYLDNVSIR